MRSDLKPASLLCALMAATALAFVDVRAWCADPESTPTFILAWGRKGDKPGEFFSPISLAFNKKDELFVTDLNNARIQKFNTDGVFLGSFDLPLDSPPRKSCMLGGMAVDRDGLIY